MKDEIELLNRAICKTRPGNRNEIGFRLACQLRDSGVSRYDAEPLMIEYANQVNAIGPDHYTPNEALASLKSAYARSSGRKSTTGKYSGNSCQPVNAIPKQPQEALTSESQSLTIAALAEAKRLPEPFLKSLGLKDVKYQGNPAVRIPYYDSNYSEIAVRFRTSLEGELRFKWRKGDHVTPYGLEKLNIIKKAGWVLIVEGESDDHTCRYYDIPSIGIPGKVTWQPSWCEYFKDLKVFVWQEPNAEDFVSRILKDLPEIRYIKAPEDIKDISEAHIQGINVPEWLEHLKAGAHYGVELQNRALLDAKLKNYAEARTIIESADPLKLIEEEIKKLGYGGDLKPAIISYLSATSRLLAMRQGSMPVHLLLMGPPSSGKNYTLSMVQSLFPEEAFYIINAGSPRTLIYGDAELAYRVLVYSEADSLPAGEDNPAASAIRNLLQEHRLSYEVAVRDQRTGEYTVRKVNKPGPTVLITTSTKSLGYQLMSRLFTLEMSDSKDQIRQALVKQADIEELGIKTPDEQFISFQRYLQLKAPIHVVVPFASRLANSICKSATSSRILRDFARLLSLIKAVAIIRQHHRKTDGEGRLLANLVDYELVRELVNDMYIDSSTGITKEIRELVEAVSHLCSMRKQGERITNTAIAKVIGVNVKQVTRWAKKAINSGWITNREQRKSYPADYELGEPMPEVEGLPILEESADIVAGKQCDNVSSLESVEVDRLTPVTDVSMPLSQEGWEEVI